MVISASKTSNREYNESLHGTTYGCRPFAFLPKCKQKKLSSKYESNVAALTLSNAESKYKHIADVIVYFNHQEEISYYVFQSRDSKCLHGILLKVDRFDLTQVSCNAVFNNFKPSRESQISKRNDKRYLRRKFKDSCNRNLIFIKNYITTNKVAKRWFGPYRVVKIVGSNVFCHSLHTRIKKKVHIDRCRLYR